MASTLSNKNRTADEVSRDVTESAERTRHFASDALAQAESKARELRDSVDPMIDMLAEKAQKLARQSKDMASQARHKTQESLTRYADVTTKYVADQPVRSVIIAAAVGAAVALLVASSRNRNRNRY
jgi:ElaB/YqjD/DUF883 family membrane-anchored ribosome-binding protein